MNWSHGCRFIVNGNSELESWLMANAEWQPCLWLILFMVNLIKNNGLWLIPERHYGNGYHSTTH